MEGRARGRSGESSPSNISSTPGFRRAEEPLCTIPQHLMTKVGEGGGGRAILVYSNYFTLNTPKDVIIYDYNVQFEPNVEAVRFRRALIYEHRAIFNSSYIYDGGASIKSAQEFTDTMTINAVDKHNGESITVTVKPTGRITWGHPEMMRFYNTQMKRNLTHLGFTRIGRNFFDKSRAQRIPEHSVEIWPGVVTAINQHDGGILMVVNSANKILRKETALDMLQAIWQKSKDHFKSNARHEMAGIIVMTGFNSKVYRVDDVVFDKNPETYLFERKGQSISLVDYYASQHGITIQDRKQPLLLVKPSASQLRAGDDKNIILVPELCLLTGMSEAMRANFALRKEMDKHVKLDPQQRMNSLRGFIRKLTSHEKVAEEMAQWSLELESDCAQITGRILQPESIVMGSSGREVIPYDQKTGSFEQSIRKESMRSPATLELWVIVAPQREKQLVDSYMDMLLNVAGPLGVQVNNPRFLWLEDDRTQSYMSAFRAIPAAAKLVHIVVPNNNAERYSTIKRYFCCDQPCATQVLTTRILRKQQMSIVTKVLMQMSVKMGAQAWALVIPPPLQKPRGTMVIGYNTYRDTMKHGQTVGAFVCTTNGELTSWYSRVSYHKSYDEMSSNFAASLKSGLKAYREINKDFPDRIVIYRDGISEGQIGYCYHNEISKVGELLKERPDLESTVWCFTIVNKRSNARFFAKPGGDSVINPIPGTIIDSVITRKERFDFFLVSQSVRVGTVNPTMYNIISDNTKWKPLNHQTLAYKLCHLYFNWAGTISVPAPCQYAYKLACLVGTSIHQEPSNALANQLYFL